MKFFLFLTFIFLSSYANATNELQYNCHVNRWNYTKGIKRICGEFSLSINDQAPVEMPDCGIAAYGGSASARKGKVMNIVLATNASRMSSQGHKDIASLAIYPESAPKDFLLSLLPGSLKYGKYSFDLECSLQSVK
jgi:hypothetical protein